MIETITIENEGNFVLIDGLIPPDILKTRVLIEEHTWLKRFGQYPPGQTVRNAMIIFIATFKNQAIMTAEKSSTFDFIHDSWYMVDNTWQKESWRCRARLFGNDNKPEFITFTELNKRGSDGGKVSELPTTD